MKKNKELTDEQLFKKAEKGDISILFNPRSSEIKDYGGKTPLHYLAIEGKIEVLSHQSITKIKDNNGWTPLGYFLEIRDLKKKDFVKLFPWYQLDDNQKITEEFVRSVLEMKPSDFLLNSI